MTLRAVSNALAAGQYPGTTTNDNAAAGAIGEYVSSEIIAASMVNLTTNVTATVTQITLTAGDWDVWVNGLFNGNAATLLANAHTYIGIGASANQTSVAYITHFSWGGGGIAVFNQGIVSLPVGPARVSIATPTIIYFSASACFSTSTMGAFGIIQARRRR